MNWLLLPVAAMPLGTCAQWERLGTARPDQSEATMTVPAESVQVGSGAVVFPAPGGGAGLSALPMLLRVGLGERVEFRAEGERTVTEMTGCGRCAAWEAPMLGAKVGMGHGGATGIRTAMLVAVGNRVGATGRRGAFAGIRLAADRGLGERWELCANVPWNGTA